MLITTYVHNIEACYKSATPSQLAEGTSWYPTARAFCAELAQNFNLPLETVVAVVAVLSPGINWASQLQNTARFIGAVLSGKAGEEAPFPAYRKNKLKAGQILQTGNLSLVSGEKVSRFFLNILGAQDCATVDRHAVRVALGAHVAPDNTKISGKEYRLFEAAYKIAARRLGVAVSTVQAVTWVVWREANV